MKRLSWSNIAFWTEESDYDSGYEEISRRTNQAHMSTFPDVFSVANFRLKSADSRSEPRVGFKLAAGEFGNY